MATIASSNISFSSLKANYITSGTNTDASGDGNLRDTETDTPISLSFFGGTRITHGGATTTVPSGGAEISINDDLKGKKVLIPVTGVSVSVTDSTPAESTAFSNYASAVIAPATANGTLTIEFPTITGGGGTMTSALTGYQSAGGGTNQRTYTSSSVSKNAVVGKITVSVKEDGSLVTSGQTPTITIQNGGGC